MARVHVNNVKSNPKRDISVYGYLPNKIDSLRESIRKSGPWKNMVAVPAGVLSGGMDKADVAQLNADLGLEGVYDGDVYIPWGHHRVEAMKQEGLEYIYFTFEALSEDDMLLQMVLENKDDYGTNMLVFLESIHQVRSRLEEMLADSEDFTDFKSKYGGDIYKSKNSFDQAKGDYGVSSGAIRKMLGTTWDQKDIGAALKILQGVDDGIYTRDQVSGIPSARAMGEFDKLAREIRKSEAWPAYFANSFIAELSAITSDRDRGASVRALVACRESVKKGRHPIRALLRGSNAPFDLAKELDKLTGAADSPFKIDDVEVRDDFQFEGLEGVIQKVKEMREKEAAKESGDAVGGENDATTLDDTMAAAGGEAGEEVATLAAGEVAEDVEADPVTEAVAMFSAMVPGLVGVIEEILPVAEQIVDNQVFTEEYQKAMIALSRLGCIVYTKSSIKKLVDEGAKQK